MKEMYALPVYSRASIESDQDIQFSVTDKLFFETLMSHLRGVIVQYSARRKRMQDGQEKYIMRRIDYLDSLASEDETIIQELERIRGELLLIFKGEDERCAG